MPFFDKLEAAIARNQSLLFVGLDPNPEMLPDRYGGSENSTVSGLYDWLCWVIAETADLVCAYKPTLGFYQALGPAGLELLLQVLQQIPPDIPIILDAKYSDLNTSSLMAHTVFADWQVDAITLNPYAGQDSLESAIFLPDTAG